MLLYNLRKPILGNCREKIRGYFNFQQANDLKQIANFTREHGFYKMFQEALPHPYHQKAILEILRCMLGQKIWKAKISNRKIYCRNKYNNWIWHRKSWCNEEISRFNAHRLEMKPKETSMKMLMWRKEHDIFGRTWLMSWLFFIFIYLFFLNFQNIGAYIIERVSRTKEKITWKSKAFI